jgi:hypothetical protein
MHHFIPIYCIVSGDLPNCFPQVHTIFKYRRCSIVQSILFNLQSYWKNRTPLGYHSIPSRWSWLILPGGTPIDSTIKALATSRSTHSSLETHIQISCTHVLHIPYELWIVWGHDHSPSADGNWASLVPFDCGGGRGIVTSFVSLVWSGLISSSTRKWVRLSLLLSLRSRFVSLVESHSCNALQ